ncbi:MAG: DUF2786 domain-containing protein, partial [Pseudonocardiaceae bacterium]
MAKRNRDRRAAAAARRRARRRAFTGTGTAGPGGAGWGRSAGPGGEPRLTPETISAALLSAAQRHRAGDQDAGERIAELLTDRCAEQPGVVEAAVRCAVPPMIGAAWAHGWSPDDLYQLARRRLGAPGISYLVDAIADESRQHAAAGVHERWREQLRQIGAQVWWEPAQDQPAQVVQDQGHLAQWSRRHRRSPVDALTTVIEVLALLISLPRLPTIMPPPGSAPTSSTRRGVDQKVLARVRGLLAKAESTTFPDEAEALSAKAQELMSRYSLERIVVETDAGSDPQPGAARRLWLESPYVAAKGLLVDAVAEANRCRAVLSEKLGFTTVLGDEVDLEIVEMLTTSLLVQATRAMVSEGSR